MIYTNILNFLTFSSFADVSKNVIYFQLTTPSLAHNPSHLPEAVFLDMCDPSMNEL